METVLRSAARRLWHQAEHHVHVDAGDWLPLYDEGGNRLEGIAGKPGAFGLREDGEELGVDLIRMEPGSAFPLHVHPGDHILIGRRGAGTVRVDGVAHPIWPGQTVFIAAEQVHGVGTHERYVAIPASWHDSQDAFLEHPVFELYAIGVPHKHVSSHERMLLVDDPGEARDRMAGG